MFLCSIFDISYLWDFGALVLQLLFYYSPLVPYIILSTSLSSLSMFYITHLLWTAGLFAYLFIAVAIRRPSVCHTPGSTL